MPAAVAAGAPGAAAARIRRRLRLPPPLPRSNRSRGALRGTAGGSRTGRAAAARAQDDVIGQAWSR